VKPLKIYAFIIITVLMALSAVGCTGHGNNDTGGKGGRLTVYASIYPMYDFAGKIGGDRIDLKQMIPPGAEPHEWEPTARLTAQIEDADVLIYNGAGIEPWINRLRDAIDSKKLIVVEASKGVDLIRLGKDSEEGYGGYDPHVWLDPLSAIKEAANIRDAFIKADAANRDYYEANYVEFSQKLSELDSDYKKGLEGIKRKDIVVAHASFAYLARRYGLNQIAIRGINPEEEPSPADQAQIVELVKGRDIKYIFFEPLTNPKYSQSIAGDSGAKVAVFNPIDGLTEEEIKNGEDYISVMKENLKTLEMALGE
jgi:zinc transport system substrate-binding protein